MVENQRLQNSFFHFRWLKIKLHNIFSFHNLHDHIQDRDESELLLEHESSGGIEIEVADLVNSEVKEKAPPADNISNLPDDPNISSTNKQHSPAPPDGSDVLEDEDVEMPMEVDDAEVNAEDPEIFGPFSRSQLEPQIQNEADQGHFDCFQDNMLLLKTAIGML